MLNIKELNVFYDELQALKDITIDVYSHDFVAIIGSNGAGKTTLLRTISGLNHSRKGKIFFEGKSIENQSPEQICKLGIIHVPEGRKLFPQMTVYENLEMGAYLAVDKGQFAIQLELVYQKFPVLKERRNQLAGTLSGGEQQMLAIGRALMAFPRLLMLDEPTLGLSPLFSSAIYKILEQLHQERMSLLLVSQDVLQTLRIVKRAYVMENGHITMEGTGVDLLRDPKVKEAFLGI